MGSIGVEIDDQANQETMTEELNSPNSMQAPDEQRAPLEQHEGDQNLFIPNGQHGSNPSGGQASNPLQGEEDIIEELRSKIFESQATQETLRNENISMSQRIVRLTQDSQEARKQQLDLIGALQDEIQSLKTRATELPKGEKRFFTKRRIICLFCH